MSDEISVANPVAKLGLKPYSGKLKGKEAVDVSLKEQDTQFDSISYDAVSIVESGSGKKVTKIPYNELSSFHVITGEGKRKPGISFEHKPDPSKAGTNYVRSKNQLNIMHQRVNNFRLCLLV